MPKSSIPEAICFSCRQPKSSLKHGFHCHLCQNILCKKCIRPLAKSAFSFLETIPEELTHTSYCETCYNQKVAPAMETYIETMNRAETLYIFEKGTKYVPLIMRSKHKVIVDDCPDRKETLLRLAFLAAEQSFNAVTQVEVVCKKIRINGYQTSSWSATGFPAKINASRLAQQS